MMAIARRSLTEDMGLKASTFTYISTWAGASLLMRTTGVRPIVLRMLSNTGISCCTARNEHALNRLPPSNGERDQVLNAAHKPAVRARKGCVGSPMKKTGTLCSCYPGYHDPTASLEETQHVCDPRCSGAFRCRVGGSTRVPPESVLYTRGEPQKSRLKATCPDPAVSAIRQCMQMIGIGSVGASNPCFSLTRTLSTTRP
jgi:hypothetical protein